MPRRSLSYHHHVDYSGQAHGGHPRDAAATTAATARSRAGYTLVHAGRQVRLGPVAFWVVIGTLVVMAVWTITTATYFAFRDDVLTRLIARQAEMQYGYEDRITELRAQVDRISSRQLLDQEQFEQKLEQMLRRQAAIESRASTLGGLPDPIVTGSIKPAARGTVVAPSHTAPRKPAPVNDKGAFLGSPERAAPLGSRTDMSIKAAGGVEAAMARVQASLDRLERHQTATLDSLEESYDAKARRIRGVLADLGVDANKLAGNGRSLAAGGPFVPVHPPGNANPFERQVYRIKIVRNQVERLTRSLSAVPVRKPLEGELDMSSGFGVRTDPFTRSPALHTGLDLLSDTGEPVHATANGKVTAAGWSGGYGKAIDIDHGNGFSTRYGHLSSIEVRVGQTVRIGQVIGKVGSTGRSTGAHLHYETRLWGEAVDPEKFLRAGAKLEGNL
jgi:murein DD-endopeptidase MepM/ murein hydrolase activator NlpD